MRKENRTYYFSVEGETEKRYFHWLQNIINSTEESKYSVKLNHSVQPNPVSYVKKLTVVEKTLITHVVDIESQDEEHLHRFMTTLDNMKDSHEFAAPWGTFSPLENQMASATTLPPSPHYLPQTNTAPEAKPPLPHTNLCSPPLALFGSTQ